MKKNIEKYQFSGDWEFNLKLPVLSKIYSDCWTKVRGSTELLAILEKGFIPFQIFDERTYEPDPTESQSNSINYLIENETFLAEAIFEIFKNQINRKYVEWCGEDEWIPELNSYEDLGKLLRINSVCILTESKNHLSYVGINFEYMGDVEHGIAIILHKEELIGFSGMYEMDYECIYLDLDKNRKRLHAEMLEQAQIGENVAHMPLEKYGKFKPWQLNSTEDYFGKLLRERKNQQLIDEIETNNWDLNLRFPSLNKNLVDIAAYTNNAEMLDYLINKGGDYSKSILQCINYGFYHPESIRFLVSKGASIDTHGYWGKTPLCNELENFARIVVRKEEYRNKDQKRYEKAIEDYEMHKQKIRFYLELGANPNLLDKEGNNYKDVALKLWNQEYVRRYKVVEQIEDLIFPIKKSNWKFWKNWY